MSATYDEYDNEPTIDDIALDYVSIPLLKAKLACAFLMYEKDNAAFLTYEDILNILRAPIYKNDNPVFTYHLSDFIEELLDELEDNCAIWYTPRTMVKTENGLRVATDEEVRLNLKVGRSILDEWGMENFQEVYDQNRKQEFDSEMKDQTGLTYVDGYEIVPISSNLMIEIISYYLDECHSEIDEDLDAFGKYPDDYYSLREKLEEEQKNE